MGDFDDLIEEFVTESREHIADIEEDLIKIEADRENVDPEVINRVFRAAHSIKGSAKFLDLSSIGDLAHKLEDVLNLIRSGRILPTSEVANPLLLAADMLKTMFEDVTSSNGMDISGHTRALQVSIDGACKDPAAEANPLAPFGVDPQVLDRKLATSQVYLITLPLGEAELSDFVKGLGNLGEVLGSCRKDKGACSILFSTIMEGNMIPAALGISQESFIQVTASLRGSDDKGKPGAEPRKAPETETVFCREAAPAPRASGNVRRKDAGHEQPLRTAKEGRPPVTKDDTRMQKEEDEGGGDREEDNTSFITFSLESETYAVPIQAIEEIIGCQDISLLPNVPPFIKGVINLRGELVPVMDLRLKFRLAPREYNPLTVFLIVRVEERVMGLVVDNVADVLVIDPARVQKTPVFSAKISTDFIEGVYKDAQDQMVILVDVAALARPEEWDAAA